MMKIEELKEKAVRCVGDETRETGWFVGEVRYFLDKLGGEEMVKITLAAIEDAGRYKKDENGLLPCPFCGGTAYLYENTFCSHPYTIKCQACPSSIPNEKDKKRAIEYWNTRADNAADRAVLEVTGGGRWEIWQTISELRSETFIPTAT